MPDADTAGWRDDLDLICGAAEAAGLIAVHHFDRGAKSWLKDGDAPVTEADMAVNRMLATELVVARPDYGWLSEESENDPARLACERVFIVDPIDGTRGFIKGSDEWTICIAVAEKGIARAGVVHNPLRQETYAAIASEPATCNGEPLSVSTCADIRRARMAASKSAIRPLGDDCKSMTRRYVHSLAYRFALVASGGVDASMSAGSAHEWDIAAATVIVEQAGGRVTHFDGTGPAFNKAHPTVGPLIAAGPDLHERLRARLGHSPETGRTGA